MERLTFDGNFCDIDIDFSRWEWRGAPEAPEVDL